MTATTTKFAVDTCDYVEYPSQSLAAEVGEVDETDQETEIIEEPPVEDPALETPKPTALRCTHTTSASWCQSSPAGFRITMAARSAMPR
ncbi:hypothetical protein [Streptomyces sp. 4N124]|uniref:hypothetical protein n=1 Tax=Streptomyces sp. 4N124 TaxID=3457420 RepID=UPI003FD4370B